VSASDGRLKRHRKVGGKMRIYMKTLDNSALDVISMF